jgi:stage V sporulation protein SpoVS
VQPEPRLARLSVRGWCARRLSRKYLHRTASSRVTRVQDGTIAVYVSQGGSCGKVAGSIAHALRAEGRVTVCATGQPSLLLAARALAVAQRYLERGGQALEFRPSMRSVRRRAQGGEGEEEQQQQQWHEEGEDGEERQQQQRHEEGHGQQQRRRRQRQQSQPEHAAGHEEHWPDQEDGQRGEQRQQHLHEPLPQGQQHDRLPLPQQHGQSPGSTHHQQQQRARHRNQRPPHQHPHPRGRHAQLLPGQQHHRHQQLPLQQDPQPRQHPQQAAGEAAAARWGKEYVLRASVIPGRRPAGGRVRPMDVAQHAGEAAEALMRSLQRNAPVEAVAFSGGDVSVLVAAAVEAQSRLRRVGQRVVVVSAGLRHPAWWAGPQGQHLVLRVQAVEA